MARNASTLENHPVDANGNSSVKSFGQSSLPDMVQNNDVIGMAELDGAQNGTKTMVSNSSQRQTEPFINNSGNISHNPDSSLPPTDTNVASYNDTHISMNTDVQNAVYPGSEINGNFTSSENRGMLSSTQKSYSKTKENQENKNDVTYGMQVTSTSYKGAGGHSELGVDQSSQYGTRQSLIETKNISVYDHGKSNSSKTSSEQSETMEKSSIEDQDVAVGGETSTSKDAETDPKS